MSGVVVVVFQSWWQLAGAVLVLVLFGFAWASWRHLLHAARAFDEFNASRTKEQAEESEP